MKWTLFLLFLTVWTGLANGSDVLSDARSDSKSDGKPAMVFDLGKTVVDHTDFVPDPTGQLPGAFAELWYIPGVRDYIISLREAGHPIVLMINIPDSWGSTQEEKLNTLKASIAKSWKASIVTGRHSQDSYFEWELFDHVLLPLNDSERKGNCDIEKDNEIESTKNCNLAFYDRLITDIRMMFLTNEIIYQTEDSIEIKEALFKGLCARKTKEIGLPDFLLPIEQISILLAQCYRKT